MNGKKRVHTFYAGVFVCTSLFFAPIGAHAQFVPVLDSQVLTAINKLATANHTDLAKIDTSVGKVETAVNDFKSRVEELVYSEPDSLSKLIAGDALDESAVSSCQRNALPAGWTPGTGDLRATQYVGGTWERASLDSGVPDEYPNGADLQFNNSQSLRCILLDMVEWQKLGLSIQIHQLLKNYIADAQTSQLNNQLVNKISAANINWAKQGNVVEDDGVITSTPVFNTNASQNIYNASSRQLKHALDQAAADPSAGNPVGSWGVFPDWRIDTAANMARNARGLTEDPFNFTTSLTESSLGNYISPGEFDNYMRSGTTTFVGGTDAISTFGAMLNNSANSPLGATSLADQIAYSRINAQAEAKKLDMTSSGFSSTFKCSGRPDDPYCLEQQNSLAVTPAAENARTVGVSAGSGLEQVQETDSLDAGANKDAQLQTSAVSEEGLGNYDTSDLQTATSTATSLVKELYDTINVGYFANDPDAVNWANATMLMIYDELKFDPKSTAVVITDGTAPVDTGYGGIMPDP